MFNTKKRIIIIVKFPEGEFFIKNKIKKTFFIISGIYNMDLIPNIGFFFDRENKRDILYFFSNSQKKLDLFLKVFSKVVKDIDCDLSIINRNEIKNDKKI